MAVSVVPGSVTLIANPKPSVDPPSPDAVNMNFTSKPITVRGTCRITGDAGDKPGGWTLGLIQLKWIDTDWSFYRGQSNSDGSLFVQAARPPALAAAACRDTIAVGGIFIDNNPGGDRTVSTVGSAFPVAMTAAFSDHPSRPFPLTRVNGKTGKVNFIREAQTEIHFCTILSLQSPAGVFQHLKHVYWNVHWQARFLPTNFASIASPWSITPTGGKLDNIANATAAIDGAPNDKKFSAIITTPGAANCNAVMNAAFASPNITESNVWTTFDVTR